MSIVVHDQIEQGTEDWFRVRMGKPTASEFHSILAKGQGKTRRSYLLRLAGEVLTGEPSETYENEDMRRGRAMEPEAREAYAMLIGADPHLVGFIENGPKGCSPDSLIGDDGMLEIKTKKAPLLIDCIVKDKFPAEHVAQCQGALWVAEREWIDLCCYWPKLPLFVKRAYRDKKYIADLADEVDRFNDDLAATVETIRRYGGEAPEKSRTHRQLEESVNIIGAG